MKCLLFIMGLTICTSANSKTLWETYLDLPSPKNARNVTKIEYSEGALPKDYGYWAPDLAIMKNQVHAGDREAFQLTYKLLVVSDGGLREELIAILASSVRSQPEMFLTEISLIQPNDDLLKRILSMPGLEYVDRVDAQRYEVLQRRGAINSVTVKTLASIKEKCILLLK